LSKDNVNVACHKGYYAWFPWLQGWSRWWLSGCLPGQIKSNISKWNKVEAVWANWSFHWSKC